MNVHSLVFVLLLAGATGCDTDAVGTDSGVLPEAGSEGVDSGPLELDGAVTLPDAGDASTAPDAGETGAPRWVGVGAWGFRSSTGDGVTWVTTLNPE